MRLIISPAKNMRRDDDTFLPLRLPVFLEQAEELRDYLRGLTYAQCRALWKCSDALTALNYERLRQMDLRHGLTPALFAYDGLQYRSMAPNVFTGEELAYAEEHLRILSGFYGVLRPFDGVQPYRLEMQARLDGFRCKTLYDYWGGLLAGALAAEDGCIVDLASKEYSRAVKPRLPEHVRWVECTFAERAGTGWKEKGTQAKMARGAMVRYLAENRAEHPEEMRGFERFGFQYSEENSSPDHFVFLKGV